MGTEIMNKFSIAFKQFPVQMMSMFLAGVVFAHFGLHIVSYDMATDFVQMIDDKINPAPTLAQRLNPFN